LKYIKGSPGKDLLYSHSNNIKVVCYSDADWAGSPSDRISTSRYCVLIGDNLISWKNKKHMSWQDLMLKQNIDLWP